MSKDKIVEHHHAAAEHHEHAAKHHREAAKHHESDAHETAAHHAHSAHGHSAHATHHAGEASKHHAENHGKHDCDCPTIGCSQTDTGFTAFFGTVGVLPAVMDMPLPVGADDAAPAISPSAISLAPIPLSPPPRA